MPQVKINDNETFDIALRRFRRLIEKTGIIMDVRKKDYYEKPTWRRKRAKAAAQKRWIKKSSNM